MTEQYPTEEELEYIKHFKVTGLDETTNLNELFAYIKDCWAYKDWGWHEHREQEEWKDATQTIQVYTISTAGWSGNEDIISALKENYVAWSLSWEQSRRGGHYIFRVRIQ